MCGTRSGNRAEPRRLEINPDLSDTCQWEPAGRAQPGASSAAAAASSSRVPALTESRGLPATLHRPQIRGGNLLFFPPRASRSTLGFISPDSWRQACVWKNVVLFSFALSGRLPQPERLQDYVCARFDTHTCKYKNGSACLKSELTIPEITG